MSEERRRLRMIEARIFSWVAWIVWCAVLSDGKVLMDERRKSEQIIRF